MSLLGFPYGQARLAGLHGLKVENWKLKTLLSKSAEIQNYRKSTEKLVNRGSAVQVEESLNKQANKQTNKQKVLKVSSQFIHVDIIHACVNVCVWSCETFHMWLDSSLELRHKFSWPHPTWCKPGDQGSVFKFALLMEDVLHFCSWFRSHALYPISSYSVSSAAEDFPQQCQELCKGAVRAMSCPHSRFKLAQLELLNRISKILRF